MRDHRYLSWGRYPKSQHIGVINDLTKLTGLCVVDGESTIIPYGNGRSYGDVCLNNNGMLFDTVKLSTIEFDRNQGLLKCGAGVTVKEVLDQIIPWNWMLPVVPGTKEVTIGGAVANDVHGKNHHVMGSFGNHIRSMMLHSTYAGIVECSMDTNSELFRATIGGLGLTGLILEVTIQLVKIPSPWISTRNIPFNSVSEFIDMSLDYDRQYSYSVGWLNISKKLGSGILQVANHIESNSRLISKTRFNQLRLPYFVRAPGMVNRFSVKLINFVYSKLNSDECSEKYFDEFLFPLDKFGSWNRVFFPRGFIQYQCVIPYKNADIACQQILEIASKSGSLSFLNVIKSFGSQKSVGMMSFPMEGITLSLDFFRITSKLFKLLDEMDSIVFGSGGRIYPGKDSRMHSKYFDLNFPDKDEFEPLIDPRYSSSYWRRVSNA